MQKQRLLPKLTMRRIALQRSKRRRQCDPRPFIASWQSCAQLSSLPLGISLSPFIHEEGLFLDTGPCGRQHLRVRGQDLRIRHAPVRRSHHTCVIRLAQISSAQPGSSAPASAMARRPPPPPPAPVSAEAPAPACSSTTASFAPAAANPKRLGAWSSARVAVKAVKSFTVRPEKPQTPRDILKRASFKIQASMLVKPSLLSKAPEWHRPVPEAKAASERFDMIHRRHHQIAMTALELLAKNPDTNAYKHAYRKSFQNIAYNRFFMPEKAEDAPVIYEPKFKEGDPHAIVPKIWNVWNYDTIWTPRKAWAESRDYHDTEQLMRKCLENDWSLCLDSHKTAHVIARNDSVEPPACLDTCFEVLWENVNFIYGMFDYYATLGASDDIFHMQLNAYKNILEDCMLFEEGSKTLNLTAFDQLYVGVTAGKSGPTARSLNRQELLQCLVRFAIMRHVATGRFSTVSEALRFLITHEMIPRVDKRCLINTHQFREECCYLQDTVEVLTSFEGNLRLLFKSYAKGDGAIGDELRSTKLLDYEEWKEFVNDMELVDRDFTAREMALTFSWSRMRVIDPDILESKIKLLQLSFEDFLEAIVRTASLKAIPDDEEVYDYECEDAGEFILKLRGGDPLGWKTFLDKKIRPWGTPMDQPIFRLVEGVCTLIFRTIAHHVASAGDARKSVKDMDNLTLENIANFRKLAAKKRKDKK